MNMLKLTYQDLIEFFFFQQIENYSSSINWNIFTNNLSILMVQDKRLVNIMNDKL